MEKLYRLVGAAGMCVRAYGVSFGVRVNDPRVLEMVNVHLPPGSSRQLAPIVKRLYSFYVNRSEWRPGVKKFHAVYSDDQMLHRSENESDLYQEFERDVNSFVAEMSTNRFFVHAGVVGWKGRAIIIPGRSYSGKSTLVAEFLRAGATYYSDEFAVFDRNGCVHPFSRPLGLRLDATGKQTKRCAHELGGKVGTKPIPVGLVIVTKYKKQGTWRPQPISAGRAVLALLANSISARNDPERALGILAQAYEGARVLHGTRGEASEVVRMVQAMLQSPGS